MKQRLSGAMAAMLTAIAWLGLALPPHTGARADERADAFMASLDAKPRQLFEQWLSAQAFHEFALDAYWREVNDKRALRRVKKAKAEPLTNDDYVLAFPPEYSGGALPPELAKAWSEYQAKSAPPTPPEPPKLIPTLNDFLQSASQNFGFEPQRISEREFKLRYAREALALGLSKDQVVRIYALETGGIGTADMQAGIHPVKKTGTAISTAIGYAQLLGANSVEETAKHGDEFIARLKAMIERGGHDADRVKALKAKMAALRRMIIAARTVANSWEAHVAFAGTPKGMGIHALNLDGDIGPWLQVVKLKGLKDLADKSGRTQLAGNEIELMNLAGPATGLEMMAGAARTVPTPNFFSRGGYNRNSVVRGKTSVELLAALDNRMNENSKYAGTLEFAEAFDQAIKEARAER